MPVYGKASTLNYKSLDQDLNYQLLELDLLVNTSENITVKLFHIADFLPWTHLNQDCSEGMNQYWNSLPLGHNVEEQIR